MRILLVLLLSSLPVLAAPDQPLDWAGPNAWNDQQIQQWQQHQSRWQALDRDGDGQLSPAEEQAAGANAWGGSTVEFSPYARSREASAQLSKPGASWQGFGRSPAPAPKP